MGIAIRIVGALGLHKEPFGLSGSSADLRRRVWWSLFCMDTFSCMTLGRPTFGRCRPSINVKLPSLCGNDIQEALATSPRIRHDQVAELDKKHVDWYEQLPLLLSTPQEATTAAISTIQTNIQWRYLNSRMLLYRSALLDYAMRLTPFSTLPPERRHVISQCRLIARESIVYIAENSISSLTAAWGSSWFMFQAVLVPFIYTLYKTLKDITTNQSKF
ncbi:hypothetical protein N7478_008733 [Penicillium angulare]|uniref:uncharacterized protein n=1 Tax=Penicillium angulare TaxID=116970 RepID=UPI002540AB9B|nr:uncharacterized protein N7478_008733 [Penicillium angulare]KAJ5273608.1 hypothetical protein N7478_008733 [Penicillium angulare]